VVVGAAAGEEGAASSGDSVSARDEGSVGVRNEGCVGDGEYCTVIGDERPDGVAWSAGGARGAD
jgi:hypothetical protein